MRRSKTEIYFHIVWATRNRQPLLSADLKRRACELIRNEAARMSCDVLALNGSTDHLHLLARVPGRVSASELAKNVKGASSRAINQTLPDFQGFAWQEGFAGFSVSRSHISRVVRYIAEQELRHQSGNLWTEWEETDGAAE